MYVFPAEWFTHDVSQGYLAPVTWIVPPFNLSDHPGGPSLCQGENWTVDIVNAIMRLRLHVGRPLHRRGLRASRAERAPAALLLDERRVPV
jgi:hypothetical protein